MALVIGGIKMSADEYQFRANTPILYGYYTSEIGIGRVPYPTLTLLPAESFKLPAVESAKRLILRKIFLRRLSRIYLSFKITNMY
jgi:hypothetical protein